MPYLQARGTRDCNKGIKFKKGEINCCYEKKNFFPNNNVWCIFFCRPKNYLTLFGGKTLNKIEALIVFEGQMRLEVDKVVIMTVKLGSPHQHPMSDS